MKLIFCTDDSIGLCFNGRRQSTDRVVREKILETAKGQRLWMNSYSYSQFDKKSENILCDESFIVKAENNDFCFVENVTVDLKKADKLYLFCWNRSYPSDFKLDFSPERDGFILESSNDFKGYSHEKITLKIYSKTKLQSQEVTVK